MVRWVPVQQKHKACIAAPSIPPNAEAQHHCYQDLHIISEKGLSQHTCPRHTQYASSTHSTTRDYRRHNETACVLCPIATTATVPLNQGFSAGTGCTLVRAAVGVERPLGPVRTMKCYPLRIPRFNGLACAVLLSPEHFIGPPPALHIQRTVPEMRAVKSVPHTLPDVGAWLRCPFKGNPVGSEAAPRGRVLPSVRLELLLVHGVLEMK